MWVRVKRSLKVAALFLVPRYFVNNFIIAHKSLYLLFISFTYWLCSLKSKTYFLLIFISLNINISENIPSIEYYLMHVRWKCVCMQHGVLMVWLFVSHSQVLTQRPVVPEGPKRQHYLSLLKVDRKAWMWETALLLQSFRIASHFASQLYPQILPVKL